MKVSLILTCAGNGTRAGFGKNKLLVNINGSTCFQKTLNAFLRTGLIDEYIITVNQNDLIEIKSLVPKNSKLVLGGETRTKSIYNALKEVTGNVVLIHDGARPFVSEKLIKDCILCANRFGSAIPICQSSDTICRAHDKQIYKYLGKQDLYKVQTPQGFLTERIVLAYEKIGDKSFNDDGEIYKNAFNTLYFFDGDTENVKLTYKEDFNLLYPQGDFRFGVGFDCHRLVEGRKLILGGMEIPHSKGLLGHSDADVLCHAISDALLSSVALRDIGYWFPDNDERFKDADSLALLSEVVQKIKEKGFKVHSVSAVIMAEKPKLLAHIPSITETLASVLHIEKNAVGISATTLEGLGFVGREEGICVHANAIVCRI